MQWNEILEMNETANFALEKGYIMKGYKLKLRIVEEALNNCERTKDVSWLKIANKIYVETKRIKPHKKREANHGSRNIGEDKELEQKFIIEPKISLDQIGGLEKSKKTLREAFEWPLRYHRLMETHGLNNVLKGCLLYGPPGCGKTMLVEAIAKDMDVSLLMANPQSLMVKWFGSSEKLIKKLFLDANDNSPSIVFIDEVDKILPASTSSSVIPRIISVFLQEMDGAGTHVNNQVIVAMASNEPWVIKEAVLRAGRCDRIIYIPPPDLAARKEIFRVHCKSPRLGKDMDFNLLAELTASVADWYYSGSDIMNICNTAKLMALRKEIEEKKPTVLSMKNMVEALESVKPQIKPEAIKRYEKWGKKHASFKDV